MDSPPEARGGKARGEKRTRNQSTRTSPFTSISTRNFSTPKGNSETPQLQSILRKHNTRKDVIFVKKLKALFLILFSSRGIKLFLVHWKLFVKKDLCTVHVIIH